MIYNPTVPPNTCPKCDRPVASDAVYCECGHPLKRVPDATAHAARSDEVPGGEDGATRSAHPDQLGPAPTGAQQGDLLFGRFRVVEELGRGGMGVVYKATDEQLNDRVVAVKVLAAHLAKDATAVARIKQEVIAAQGLQHPGIIRINTFHEGQGLVGFDMKHLNGATLGQHLAGDVPGSPFASPATLDRLPVVASIVEQLAEVLDLIHREGLVHRDVKPSNVMLIHHGQRGFKVTLLDFGIVHIEGGDFTGVAQPGTPAYMAPELADAAAETSPASDLFSVGKVVYLALTGKRAKYGAESDPPSSLVAGLPSSVDEPILSCMAARPDRRPKTAAALAEVIRGAAGEVEEAARQEAARLAAEEERREAEEESRRKAEQEAEDTRRKQAEAERRRQAEEERRRRAEREARTGTRREAQRQREADECVRPEAVGRSPRRTAAIVVAILAMTLVAGIKLVSVVGPKLSGSGGAGTIPAEIEWVRIPGGTFAMGQELITDAMPVHDVTVPAFEMARTEVTVAQYRRCVVVDECTEPETSSYCNWGKSGKDDHPVNCADWNQARTFASWAGGRLPSEAEWEYAARGDDPHPYAGSTDADAVACRNRWESKGGTCVVGSRAANGFGLSDMSGNVGEWVEDCYGRSYVGVPTDGSTHLSCAGSDQVVRGGSWWHTAPDFVEVTCGCQTPSIEKSRTVV